MAGSRRRSRKRRGRASVWKRLAAALLFVPTLYAVAALIGGFVPLNRAWVEPAAGTTVYLRTNGVHVDIVMPATAQGLDWRPYFPAGDFREAPASPRWFAVGAGERRVYLETPTWSDLTPRTLWSALTGGERVLHVGRSLRPGDRLVAIRLRPEEYRRLWAAVRAQFALSPQGRPLRLTHPGYGPDDAFYEARGRANAVNTCNQWVADQLRIAGVKVSAWAPFPLGLRWRYRSVPSPLP